MNKYKRIVFLVAVASIMIYGVSRPALASPEKPNILVIMVDNLGYGELGAYGGGELRGALTPRIDKLAAEGLRLKF